MSREWRRTGLPSSSRNCFGRSAFMRLPTPPASSTTETPSTAPCGMCACVRVHGGLGVKEEARKGMGRSGSQSVSQSVRPSVGLDRSADDDSSSHQAGSYDTHPGTPAGRHHRHAGPHPHSFSPSQGRGCGDIIRRRKGVRALLYFVCVWIGHWGWGWGCIMHLGMGSDETGRHGRTDGRGVEARPE